MINPNINNRWFQDNSWSGYSIQFYNLTENPVYIMDGTPGNHIRVLQPMIVGGYSKQNAPTAGWGGVSVFWSDFTEEPMMGKPHSRITNRIKGDWVTLGRPPTEKGPDLDMWTCISKEYNVVLGGSRAVLEQFKKEYGSVYDYIKKTTFGTNLFNGIHWNLVNYTGFTIYQVDDTITDESNNVSDIVSIPSGPDYTEIDLWKQQAMNNMYNRDVSIPYFRVCRNSYIQNDDDSITGHMRERIFYWRSEDLTEDGCLYIPEFRICLFNDVEKAKIFINRYRTVMNYEKCLIAENQREFLAKRYNSLIESVNRKNSLIVKGCSIFVSLQIAWKIGEIIIWNIKSSKTPKVPLGMRLFDGIFTGKSALSIGPLL
jgi:hypothetical protein